MSHHRDTPLAAQNGQPFIDDLYVFPGEASATFGFAGRDGRTKADNAPEAVLSLVAGTAIPSGLRPSVAAEQRSPAFPYVVPAR